VEGFELDVGFEKEVLGESVLLFEESEKEMFDVDLLVLGTSGFGLSGAEGVLEFFSESVEVHD
jgi:hypothetical protein